MSLCHAVRLKFQDDTSLKTVLYSVVLFFIHRYFIPLHMCSKEPKKYRDNFCVTSVLAKTLLTYAA